MSWKEKRGQDEEKGKAIGGREGSQEMGTKEVWSPPCGNYICMLDATFWREKGKEEETKI